MTVVADLHVHTTNSDGTLRLADLPAAAREVGVEAVAVTDHDRVHSDLDSPVGERDGVTVIHGIELRVEVRESSDDDHRVDLLGYAVDPTPHLRAEIERLQTDRVERTRAIADCVADRLGVELSIPLEPGVGRPHVARAVVAHPGTEYAEEGAVFADLIGDDGPCYVAREVPSFDRGAALLADACGLVGLAHPLRYDDPDAALALCADHRIGAVEVHYPYGRSVADDEFESVRRTAREHDLVVTGGSDAHGEDLGVAGLDADEYEAFRAALE